MLRPIIIIYHTHAQTHFHFHACLLLLRPMLRPIISDHSYRESQPILPIIQAQTLYKTLYDTQIITDVEVIHLYTPARL